MVSEVVLNIGLGLVVIPWCIWVTVSLFNQFKSVAMLEQQLAAHKQELSLNREILQILRSKRVQ